MQFELTPNLLVYVTSVACMFIVVLCLHLNKTVVTSSEGDLCVCELLRVLVFEVTKVKQVQLIPI